MAGFVERLVARERALEEISTALAFPWSLPQTISSLETALGGRLAQDLQAIEPSPAFSRSLRDGFAVRSVDVRGASPSSPSFLTIQNEVPMGQIPSMQGFPGAASALFTGGALPEGFDAVVMSEDTSRLGNLLEVRRAVPRGEHISVVGEDVALGDIVARRGDTVTPRHVMLLATLGIVRLPLVLLRVGILSTGDEIVSSDTPLVPLGFVRDANAPFLRSYLQSQGCTVSFYGIAEDNPRVLQERFYNAWEENDVVLISGGSSVSSRDFCTTLLADLPAPGLIVRGINIAPGKPTLLAGSRNPPRLAIGLPGHPLSCAVVAVSVVAPLLQFLCQGHEDRRERRIWGPIGKDLIGKTGVEEFLPAQLHEGEIWPLPAKSGHVRALSSSDGFVRLPENRETVRKGDLVELWLW